MILIFVNGIPFEFDEGTTLDIAVKDAIKHPQLIKLTGVKKNCILYLKNNLMVKNEELNNHEVKAEDNIIILAITSGG